MNSIPATGCISNFRIVKVYWKGNGEVRPSTYIIHKDEVAVFVEATVKLHHSPGINPHSGNQTNPIAQITVGEIFLNGPFWWSTPDLAKNGDPNGARVADDNCGETVFSAE